MEVKTGGMKVSVEPCRARLDRQGVRQGVRSHTFCQSSQHRQPVFCHLHHIQVVILMLSTTTHQGASTDARVGIELLGPFDEATTGDLRLVISDSHRPCFSRNGLDMFLVSCVFVLWEGLHGERCDSACELCCLFCLGMVH